jgi:hypothetical protein
VKAAQRLLRKNDGKLVVDGIWGVKSERSFVGAPVLIRQAVLAVVKESGYELEDIRSGIDVSTLVSPEAMSSILARVEGVAGVKSSVMQKFVDLEAARFVKDGVRYYVPQAKNAGGYRGLFQFDGRGNAWQSASKIGDLPSFESSWADPYFNALAAAYYTIFNTRILRARGYAGEITGSIAYLAHNQGAGGAFAIMTGKRKVEGQQSSAAMIVVAEAINDYRHSVA